MKLINKHNILHSSYLPPTDCDYLLQPKLRFLQVYPYRKTDASFMFASRQIDKLG